MTPPSVTDADRSACTTRSLAPVGSVDVSGKFCALVAIYVAIPTPPELIESTRVYVLPTCCPPDRWSLTEVTCAEPSQKNVATIASPTCGLGLNRLPSCVPFPPMTPLPWVATASSSMPLGPLGPWGAGLSASLHPAASSAAATSLGRTDVRL